MHKFNSPPGWPDPPTPDWRPPPGWRPDPAWPSAPPGWAFWLNSRGLRARGPSGRYGAEPPVKLIAGWVAGGIAFLTVLAAIGGSGSASSSPGPAATATATATASVTVTVPGPTETTSVTVPGPTETITGPPQPARTVTLRPGAATVTVTERAPLTRSSTSSPPKKTTAPAPTVYYANCAAVRAAGKAPLYRGQPGYASHLDRDGDGVACE